MKNKKILKILVLRKKIGIKIKDLAYIKIEEIDTEEIIDCHN